MEKLHCSLLQAHLYIMRAVKSPILVTLNDIGNQQASPTENSMGQAKLMIDFLHTHPNAKLLFFAGKIQLAADSDAAYLFLPGAISRYAGNFYLEANPNPLNYNKAPNNAPI